MTLEFKPVSRLDDMGKNILRKRYYDLSKKETKWKHVASRVVNYIAGNWKEDVKSDLYDMIYNRYFLPNSPTLVNSGKEKHAGLNACFVLPFMDTIEDIYKTKLDFALIARKGGGCGTTLSDLRPEGDIVNGSTHGFSGGPVRFADTISHDMDVITQAGFRSMAIMFTISVYHPDILKFITAKTQEGKISNANISVVVDDAFMQKVENDEKYWTEFSGKKYKEYSAKEIFEKIVDGAWSNGEPGILFSDKINDSPYKYTGIEIKATNPCGEQPLPPYGSCNLGSLDVSKFMKGKEFQWELFEKAIRLSVRFLDCVIDVNEFPTKEIEEMAKNCRQIGLGIMGEANLFMAKEIAYGSKESVEELESVMKFMYETAKNESEIMGKELDVPKFCKKLPEPRRNITLISIAPTGSISLIAGCNSGIEPFFSEITERKDKTGEYTIDVFSDKEWFRCSVSSSGEKEVTWEEHIAIQASAQKWCDSGISKTINFPQHTRKETIGKAYMMAWKMGCKGITVYRNGSRSIEVLSPKNITRDRCPVCGEQTVKYDGCKKCTKCEWSICAVG